MQTKELIRFIQKRAKDDTPLAFACRMARFAVIAPYMPFQKVPTNFTEDGFKGCVIREIQGSKMYLDLADEGLSWDLLRAGIREPYITKVVQNTIKPDDVCLDIGANIGYYVLQEARLCRKVFAVEPVRESVELLMNNIRLNNYKNVSVFQLACGDENKDTIINVSSRRNWSSIHPCNDRTFVRQDLIQMVTVDDFIMMDEWPTFIRMDVEGYEYEIVKGMKRLFASGRPLKLFIEMHFDILRDKTVELAQILKDAGFEIKVATIEPHPAIANNRFALGMVRQLEKGIGAQTGYANIYIDDLIQEKIYRNGQVEWMEVLFER